MKLLITGGAGYIGSHMVKMLLQRGHAVTVIDDLSNGSRDAVLGGEFVLGDCGNTVLLERLFQDSRFDGVMHFAGSIQVAESVDDPMKYYKNNVVKTIALLNSMLAHNVKRLVFSSSAAVYGEPERVPIDEDNDKLPINPYGVSKWMIERILQDYGRAYAMGSISLRYFNAAGADPEGMLGSRHHPETHLLPLVLQAASGRKPCIRVFGRDYDTCDGTCVRDFIHVQDLCEAHLLAIQKLRSETCVTAYNLGSGNGYSVQEVIAAAEKVTGVEINVLDEPRRNGDPARLIADARRANNALDWYPHFTEIETIVEHAWKWEKKLLGATTDVLLA